MRLSSPTQTTILYPQECQFCGKNRVQHSGQKITPLTIKTKDAETTIKNISKERNPGLYGRIKDEDLVAKEFRYHTHCYRNFTRQWTSESKVIYDKGNFDAVSDFITKEIVEGGRIVPIDELTPLYGLGDLDNIKTSYENRLKQRIIKQFGERIVILSTESKQIYIARKDLNEENPDHKEEIIEKAATYLREDIKLHVSKLENIVWPPTIEQLSSEERQPPESVRDFFNTVLTNGSRQDNNFVTRLVDSFSQDLVHGVTKGKVIMEKHFLIGLGLHNLTGKKNVVEILNKFGHSLSYSTATEILTAYAESNIEKLKSSLLLPLQPCNPGEIVLTYFWVDNFDLETDKQYGGGAINITTMMAFQEGGTHSTSTTHFHVPRKKSRRISSDENLLCLNKVDRQIEPPRCTITPVQQQHSDAEKKLRQFYCVWIVARYNTSFDPIIPIFSGFMTNLRKATEPMLKKTVETYLPPINSKV